MSMSMTLGSLRAIESELYSRKIQRWLRRQSAATQRKFSQARLEFTAYVDALKAATLQEILAKLEANETALEKAVDELDVLLDDIETFKKIADAIAKVVGVLTKVVGILPV